jgi:hypothetical protein
MTLKFTLDTNCIISVEKCEANSVFIRELADAHSSGRASVSLAAISASERQQDDAVIENFEGYKKKLSDIDLGHLNLLKPMLYWDVSFWDCSLWSDDSMKSLERSIHDILFPEVQFDWIDFCKAKGLNAEIINAKSRWRNAKCDVQAFWCHAYHKQNIFVTSDGNFHKFTKKDRLIMLTGGRIETPSAAAALLSRC